MPDPTPDFSPLCDTESPWRTVAPEIFGQFDAIAGTALIAIDPDVTQPSSIDDALVRHVNEQFDAAEVVEIVLDVARNAANKIAVAFGADAPNVTEGVEYFDLDGAGEVIANVDAEVVRAGTALSR